MAYLHVTYTHTECKPVYLFAIQFSSYPATSRSNSLFAYPSGRSRCFVFRKNHHIITIISPETRYYETLNCSPALTYIPTYPSQTHHIHIVDGKVPIFTQQSTNQPSASEQMGIFGGLNLFVFLTCIPCLRSTNLRRSIETECVISLWVTWEKKTAPSSTPLPLFSLTLGKPEADLVSVWNFSFSLGNRQK